VATESNEVERKESRRQQRQDELDRIPIEGKFGQGKRRFTLNRIMAKLAETSEAVIMVSFIVMNLEKILSSIIIFIFGSAAWLRHWLSNSHHAYNRWRQGTPGAILKTVSNVASV